jgi:hypothetical protein
MDTTGFTCFLCVESMWMYCRAKLLKKRTHKCWAQNFIGSLVPGRADLH